MCYFSIAVIKKYHNRKQLRGLFWLMAPESTMAGNVWHASRRKKLALYIFFAPTQKAESRGSKPEVGQDYNPSSPTPSGLYILPLARLPFLKSLDPSQTTPPAWNQVTKPTSPLRAFLIPTTTQSRGQDLRGEI